MEALQEGSQLLKALLSRGHLNLVGFERWELESYVSGELCKAGTWNGRGHSVAGSESRWVLPEDGHTQGLERSLPTPSGNVGGVRGLGLEMQKRMSRGLCPGSFSPVTCPPLQAQDVLFAGRPHWE